MPDKCEKSIGGSMVSFLNNPPTQTRWWWDYLSTHDYNTTTPPNPSLLREKKDALNYTKNQQYIPNTDSCDSAVCYFHKAPNYNNLKQYGRGSADWEFPRAVNCGDTGKGCSSNGQFTGWTYGGDDNGKNIYYALCGDLEHGCPDIGKYRGRGSPVMRKGDLRQDIRTLASDTRMNADFVDNIKCAVNIDAIRNETDVENLRKSVNANKVPKSVADTLVADYCLRTTGSGVNLDYPNIGNPTCVNLCYENVNTSGKHKNICMTEKARERWLRTYCKEGGNPGILDFSAPGKSICEDECYTPAGLSEWCINERNTYCQDKYNKLKSEYDAANNSISANIPQVQQCAIM